MTTPRIFSHQPLAEKQLHTPGEDLQHYLRHVLRIGIGDAVTLFDGLGSDYRGVVERLNGRDLAIRIVERAPLAGKNCRLTLAQALPKGAKMDDIVEKTTELGVDRVIPFFSSRSVPKWSAEKAADRVSRWRKIAVEAARRCRRPDIPPIEGVVSYEDMLRMAVASLPPPGTEPGGAGDGAISRIIFWEEGGRAVKEILGEGKRRRSGHYFIVIGPEGGFSREEVESARSSGFVVASLGAQVLRVETASLVVLTILQYELGIFSEVET